MRSLVTSKTLLFLGFSFTDEYLPGAARRLGPKGQRF